MNDLFSTPKLVRYVLARSAVAIIIAMGFAYFVPRPAILIVVILMLFRPFQLIYRYMRARETDDELRTKFGARYDEALQALLATRGVDALIDAYWVEPKIAMER